jgi:hypothetical protein
MALSNAASALNPAELLKFAGTTLTQFWYLVRTRAPLAVLTAYVRTSLGDPLAKLRHRARLEEFRASTGGMRFSNDWFTSNIPSWLLTFDECGLAARPRIDALEIGCFEGRSSLFLVTTFPQIRITCVDLWGGSKEIEHHGARSSGEENFDANLAPYMDRITKRKGTSMSYFHNTTERSAFDLIYVDGSHYCDDVMVDALRSFELLKVGGILIFDDYLWRYYRRPTDNPAGPINAFLKLKKGCYRIVRVYWQLVLVKTAEADER